MHKYVYFADSADLRGPDTSTDRVMIQIPSDMCPQSREQFARSTQLGRGERAGWNAPDVVLSNDSMELTPLQLQVRRILTLSFQR